MTIKISQLPNLSAASLSTASSVDIPLVADISSNVATYRTSLANVKTYVGTGNLTIDGGLTVTGISTLSSNVIIAGNLSVQGTTTSTSSQNLSTNASIIDLHTFNANLGPWTSDDGRDIGFRFYYYKDSTPSTAALYWENSNGYLTWMGASAGNSNLGQISGSATLGTMQVGDLLVSNATPTTGNATGALQVGGGISAGGNLFVAGFINGAQTITSTGSILGRTEIRLGNVTTGNTVTSIQEQGTAAVIEHGRTDGSGGAAIIDFHSGVVSTDYDCRMQVSGGNSSAGGGTLGVYCNSATFYASSVSTSANTVVYGAVTVNAGNSLGTYTAIENGGSNGTGNIGSSVKYFNTLFAKATSAQYADLAEIYEADADYEPGTVVVFGGEKEITVTSQFADSRVAGAISTEPSYLMNSGAKGLPVALRGKIPLKVIGPVSKGDLLVTSNHYGLAKSLQQSGELASSLGIDTAHSVFAKSLVDDPGTDPRVIWAVIL